MSLTLKAQQIDSHLELIGALSEAGINTVSAYEWFLIFAQSEGSAIPDIAEDIQEERSAVQYYLNVLGSGNANHPGLGLIERRPASEYRGEQVRGARKPIALTKAGQKLAEQLDIIEPPPKKQQQQKKSQSSQSNQQSAGKQQQKSQSKKGNGQSSKSAGSNSNSQTQSQNTGRSRSTVPAKQKAGEGRVTTDDSGNSESEENQPAQQSTAESTPANQQPA